MNEKSFGAVIRETREALGLSQGTLASKSGLSQATISRIESDTQRNLTEETKARLLGALGIGTEDKVWESKYNKLLEDYKIVVDELLQYKGTWNGEERRKPKKGDLG